MPDMHVIEDDVPDSKWLERWRNYLIKKESEGGRPGTTGMAESIRGINILCDLALEGMKSHKKNCKPARRLAAQKLREIADQLDQ